MVLMLGLIFICTSLQNWGSSDIDGCWFLSVSEAGESVDGNLFDLCGPLAWVDEIDY